MRILFFAAFLTIAAGSLAQSSVSVTSGTIGGAENESAEFYYSTIEAQKHQWSTWSLKIDVGGDWGQWVGHRNTKKGFGFLGEIGLEKTFNPWWGLGLNYGLLNFNNPVYTGWAHEFSVIGSVNITNLLAKYRTGCWRKLSVYGHLGGGVGLYRTKNDITGKRSDGPIGPFNVTGVIPSGLTVEYSVGPRLTLALRGDHRWHTADLNVAPVGNTPAVAWGLTVGARIKLGSKPHICNTGVYEYETALFPEGGGSPVGSPASSEQLDRMQQQINDLNKAVEDSKAKAQQAEDAVKQAQDAAQKCNDEVQQLKNRQPTGGGDGGAAKTVNYNPITFNPSSAVIDMSVSKGALDQIASTMKADPNDRLLVTGHTDNTGEDRFNKQLSLNRAESVRDYLVGKGIAAERITTVGMGQTKPIATNDTPEGRQKNRRVEIQLLDY